MVVKVNPNAFVAGGLLYVKVAVPLNVLLKLFAVERSNVTLPPVPKSECVSLKVVDVICVEDTIFPVIDKLVPSNVKLFSTFA